MPLTGYQESTLTSGGDCFDHWHSSDRILTHDDIGQLQRLSAIINVTGNITASFTQDVLLCDTTSTSFTVSLPVAAQGVEIEIVKIVQANTLTIQLSGTDLIYGQSSVLVYNIGTALRFKSITGGWILI